MPASTARRQPQSRQRHATAAERNIGAAAPDRGALLDGPEQRKAERDQREARPDAQRVKARERAPRVDLADPDTVRRQHNRSSAPPSASKAAGRRAATWRQQACCQPTISARDGNVDREQPSPARAQQQPAEQRAKQERDAEHGTDEPERPTAALERHGLGDDGRAQREKGRRRRTLGPRGRAAAPGTTARCASSEPAPNTASSRKHAPPARAVRALREQRRAEQVEQHVDAEHRRQQRGATANVPRIAGSAGPTMAMSSAASNTPTNSTATWPTRERPPLVRPQQQAPKGVAEQRVGRGWPS